MNDYVFGEQCAIMFGKIIGLYRISAEQSVDLDILEDLNIDSQSGISFASIDSDSFTEMVKMSLVSNTVVTAVEKNCIWFVSH